MKPLVVIPNYMSHEADMEILGECVQSIRRTVSDTVDILIIDDRSPRPTSSTSSRSATRATASSSIRKDENEGFSRTVNVGLRARAATRAATRS